VTKFVDARLVMVMVSFARTVASPSISATAMVVPFAVRSVTEQESNKMEGRKRRNEYRF